MLDLNHLASSTKADVQVFMGPTITSWSRPRGVSMLYVLCVGAGGNGGNGAVGAASNAAGGGGGGSGGQSTILIPAIFVPETLYVAVGDTGQVSYVSANFAFSANNTLVGTFGGGNGGNASGSSQGAAGTGGLTGDIIAYLRNMGRSNSIAGQAGSSGGSAAAGGTFSLPTTGLVVTGGAGGAGTPAAFSPGQAGGSIIGAGPLFPSLGGGIGTSFTTVPPRDGSHGFQPIPKLLYNYGGTGGGSTHGSATGAGLVGAHGGNGAPGCGGGGGGGALTGSTQGLGGRGGPGFIIIIAW